MSSMTEDTTNYPTWSVHLWLTNEQGHCPDTVRPC